MTKLLAKDGEGERLDRFELITELASGGMATVYLARLSGVAGFQRLVAIKRLHPHLAREPEFVEMFLDEARLAARIHHPNVVPIQEVGESDSGYYLVMDYVEGDTFARVLARASQAKTTVPHGVTIRVLLDVLAGLHTAHELKDDHGQPLEIVHRDVSPQNILVGADGVARLVDFGVARAASRLSTTRSGQLKGKLAYMAPEQARGKGVDRRADIFSCGIVLWEALALKRLFKGDGEAETLNRVLYDEIPPPSSVKPDLPKSLEDVCMKALHRDVDQRYATAQDFADDLEKAARALACIGSVRDVASTLDLVLGADLTQQREAVRSWLSRSEPSSTGPRSKPEVSQPAKESVVTRVEGGTKSEPSSARGDRRSFTPSSPPSTSRPRIDRHAVTAPAPPDMGSSPGGDKVSSVSSAVLQMPDVSSVNASSSLQPGRSKRGRVAIALGAAAVVLVATAWGAKTYVGGARTTASPPAPPASTAAPAAPSAAPPVEKAADKPADTSAATTASAAASSSTTVAASAHAKPPVGKPGAASKPVAPVVRPPGNVPDDMSKNPYR